MFVLIFCFKTGLADFLPHNTAKQDKTKLSFLMSEVAGQETQVNFFASLVKLDTMVKKIYFMFEKSPDVKTIPRNFEWVSYCKIFFKHLFYSEISEIFPTDLYWEGWIVVFRVTFWVPIHSFPLFLTLHLTCHVSIMLPVIYPQIKKKQICSEIQIIQNSARLLWQSQWYDMYCIYNVCQIFIHLSKKILCAWERKYEKSSGLWSMQKNIQQQQQLLLCHNLQQIL